MNLRRHVLVLALLTLSVSVQAADQPLAGRHALGMGFGMWGMTADARVEAVSGTVSTSVGSNGLLGDLFYNYWLQENLALAVSIGARDLDMSTEVGLLGVSSSSAVVGSLLLGMRYSFPPSSLRGPVRPYVGAGIGVANGSQDAVTVGLTTAVTSREDQALAGRLESGVAFVPGRHVLIDLRVGYDLMADFNEPIAGSRNYSGPTGSVGVAFVFGQGED